MAELELEPNLLIATPGLTKVLLKVGSENYTRGQYPGILKITHKDGTVFTKALFNFQGYIGLDIF